CNDNDPCTSADVCSGGSCKGGPPTSCDDGDPCTTDGCQAPGGCEHVRLSGCRRCDTPAECDDGDVCTTETCVDHVCQHTQNTASCDDGNACTTGDRCAAGRCAGTPVVCSPSDQCHLAGSCNPGTGTCSNPAKSDGSTCNDGSACTDTDTCQA